MALPVFFILNAGRIISVGVGIGTALARFVAENPKIIAEITTNPNMSIQEIFTKNPKIIGNILKNIL